MNMGGVNMSGSFWYNNHLFRRLLIVLISTLLTCTAIESQAQTISSSEEVLDLSKQTIKVKSFNTNEIPLYPEKGLSKAIIDDFLSKYLIDHSALGAVTINQLHSAADELTRLYRSAGFIFHRAFIPEQKIKNSRVKIEVRKGKLSSIHVYNQQKYSANRLISFFDELIGMPIETNAIEAALFKVNSIPGLQVFGYFSAGAQEDETRLNLRVIEEDSFFTNISLDNYGTKTTGLYHLNLNTSWINPFGESDILQFGLSQAYEPENSLYGYIQYRTQFLNQYNDIYLSYSNNNYELGDQFSALLVSGKSDNYRLGTNYKLISNPSDTLSINTEYYKHNSNIVSKFSDQLNKDIELDRFQIELNNNYRNSMFWSLGTLGIRQTTQKEENELLDNEYYYNYISLSAGLNFITPWIPDLKLQGLHQEANDSLSPLDKLLLTGPNKVRGIESGYLSVDRGTILHAEAAWSNSYLKFFIFTDSGLGTKIATIPGTSDSQFNLTSAGLGLSLRLSENWSAKIQSAQVLIAEQSIEKDNTNLSVHGEIYTLAETNYQVRF